MEPISRRSLFAGACAVVALAGSEVPAAANAAVRRLPGGKLSVTLKNLPALSAVGGATRIGSIKGVPIGIARVGTNLIAPPPLLGAAEYYFAAASRNRLPLLFCSVTECSRAKKHLAS